MNKTWSDTQTKYLVDNYSKVAIQELASQLGKSYKAIVSKAKTMKLKTGRQPAKWTSEERQVLELHYPSTPMPQMLAFLPGKTQSAIYGQANIMGLKRSEEWLKSKECGRIYKGIAPNGTRHKFEKGHKTWNAGTKGLTSRNRTTFKKGNIPPQLHPDGDGAITIRNHKGTKYKYIRVSKGKWKELHRYLWEQANGEIPKTHIVIFKDGNTMNCELGNLQMITMEDNMKRNTMHNYPQELKELIHIKIGFSRRLNHIIKKYNDTQKQN